MLSTIKLVVDILDTVRLYNALPMFPEGKEPAMDAIIGRYRARMEESGLILRHAAGINFDLTLEETLGLLDFINAYRQTLLALRKCETDPAMERITIEREQQAKDTHPFDD